MLLVLGVMAVNDRRNAGAADGLSPLCVGLVVLLIGMTFGQNAGYAINPARDFAPRLFTAIGGWGPAVFVYVRLCVSISVLYLTTMD